MKFNLQGTTAELKTYIENDDNIYQQKTISVLTNLSIKKATGHYTPKQALAAFLEIAETGAQQYAWEFGRTDTSWREMFSLKMCQALAQEWCNEFETEYALGNYNNFLPVSMQQPSPMVEVTRKARSKLKKVPWQKLESLCTVLGYPIPARDRGILARTNASEAKSVLESCSVLSRLNARACRQNTHAARCTSTMLTDFINLAQNALTYPGTPKL